jgi:hypothetical protein
MSSLASLAQALGVAYASGINLYATVALLGLAERYDWVGPLPDSLAAVGSWWVIGLAVALYLFEFVATLVPGVASAWESFHTVIRPPAAAALAVATAWHGDALFVLVAALLGGGLALTTHATKLGLRYAIDTSPEPVTNGAANLAELGLVASVTFAIWHHPYLTLAVALLVLLALMIVVRLIWRALRRVFRGNWMPKPGLMQSPRCSTPRVSAAVRSRDDRIVD